MTELTGNLAINGALHHGTVRFGTHIEQVHIQQFDPVPGAPTIIPGFVDVHVHGGGGHDTMDGAEAIPQLAAFHLGHGTTTMVPTTITEQPAAVLRAVHGVKAAARHAPSNIAGVHVEGPFIHPAKLGAQPPHARPLELSELQALLATGVVRIITLAPELSVPNEALQLLAEHNVAVSIGHTLATYEQAAAFTGRAHAAGVQVGYTHIYNAMSGLQSREPGVVGAALTNPHGYAELIADLHHVHPAAALLAHRALGKRFMLVTDAIRAAGMAAGESELGGQTVFVVNGQARLADGTLAGSTLTMWDAFTNAQRMGLSLAEASFAASTAPANYLRLADAGRIQNGARADLLVLTKSGEASAGFVLGREFILQGGA